MRHRAMKERFETRIARAREGILVLQRKHRALVVRRAEEVVYLSDEVSTLRRGVTELERRTMTAW